MENCRRAVPDNRNAPEDAGAFSLVELSRTRPPTSYVRVSTMIDRRRHKASIPIIGILVRMGKNTSFSLDEHFSAFIEEEVASGRYASASDVVRAALRLLEDRETRIRTLRQALIAGEQSGESTPLDFDAFVARKRAAQPRRR